MKDRTINEHINILRTTDIMETLQPSELTDFMELKEVNKNNITKIHTAFGKSLNFAIILSIGLNNYLAFSLHLDLF